MKVHDVEPNRFIEAASKKLMENDAIKPPAFVSYAKTGSHVERMPEDSNFWYKRCASILRQAYIRGKVSIGGLRVHYGGRARHVVKAAHHRDAGGSMIRKAFQQLEQAGLLRKEGDGRVLTPQGRKFVDSVLK